MNGTNASSGKKITGIDHLRQSITDILTTPVGSRVMRRDYGSDLYRLIDAPMNRATIINIYAAVAVALDKWEPRLKLESVKATEARPGQIILEIMGEYLPDGETITLDGVVVN